MEIFLSSKFKNVKEDIINYFIKNFYTIIRLIELNEKIDDFSIINLNDIINKYEDRIFKNNFNLVNKINNGAFGIIYKFKKSNIMKCNIIKKYNNETLNEIKILELVQNKDNFTKIKYNIKFDFSIYGYEYSRYCIIMEKYDGNLYELMYGGNKNLYEIFINNIDSIFKKLEKSVNYLHSNNIIHNDIKLENIMYKKISNKIKFLILIYF